MIYFVSWKGLFGNMANGFVKADSLEDAYSITMKALRDGCCVTEVCTAHESMITPQSLTINFTNETEYGSF